MKFLAKPFIFLRNLIGRHPIITILILIFLADIITEYRLRQNNFVIYTWGFLFFFSIASIIYCRKNPTTKYNEKPTEYEEDLQNNYEEYKPLTQEEIRILKSLINNTPIYNSTYKNAYESKFLFE